MDDRVKVLYILPKAHQGGAEVQLLLLLKNLDKSKFDAYLGFLYSSPDLETEFKSIPGINFIYLNKKNKMDLGIYFRIASIIKEKNIDIIHTFLGNHHSYIPAMIAGKSIAIGGIMGMEDSHTPFSDWFEMYVVEKWFVRFRRLILVSCSYMARELCIKKGFVPSSLYFIANGIDYYGIQKGDKKKVVDEFRLKNKFVLGIVARLIATKNHAALLRIFKFVLAKKSNAVLLIIGAGPELENLKAQASELGISRSVIFTGNRKDVRDLLAAMDIFVFPSISEGMPNVIGEAMSAGVAVVSYPVGDVPHMIKNGEDGIVTEKNEESMKKAILGIMDDRKKLKMMGEKARVKMEENYLIEYMVEKYQKLYFSLMKEKNKK